MTLSREILVTRVEVLELQVESLKKEGVEQKVKNIYDDFTAIKRKLGTEEYKSLSVSNLEHVKQLLSAEAKSELESFVAWDTDESDRLKYLIGAAFSLVPAAKLSLMRNLIKSESSDMRACILTYLDGLCKKDNNSKILLKEVVNQDVDGVTPLSSSRTDAPGKPCKKVLVHDESLDRKDYKAYYNALNVGCKVINHGSVEVLAFTKSAHVVTPHKLRKDSSGNIINLKSSCAIPSCRKEFFVNKTKIAPVTVVGPASHGNLGGCVWVCEEHWRDSTDPAEDDDFCSSAVLHHEASVLDEHAGLQLASQSGVSRAKRALFAKNRKNKEDSDKEATKESTIETAKGTTSATKLGLKVSAATKKGAASKSSKDPPKELLIDSDTVLGRSDDEK